MIDHIAICRNIGGPGWLLMQRDAGKWRMLGAPSAPLSGVVANALKELGGGDLSFTDRRMDTQFTFPTKPTELTSLRNVTVTVMAPERDQPDLVWGTITRDFAGGMSRGTQRWRTQALSEEIAKWLRDPHGSGGYSSFDKPGELPYRELLVRRGWRLKDIAPELFVERAA